jgi:rhamnogalacturonan endolyase
VAEDHVHGVYGERHGVWLITSSHEYFNGGPIKQELMVHVETNTGDGVVLNMLSASHFGTPSVKIPSGKIYGPLAYVLLCLCAYVLMCLCAHVLQ